MGTHVIYTKYLLLFKIKGDSDQFDSVIIYHTSEYKNIREYDQTRLEHFLRNIRRRILKVYVKQLTSDDKDEYALIVKQRRHAISKYLHETGIPYSRIKTLGKSD